MLYKKILLLFFIAPVSVSYASFEIQSANRNKKFNFFGSRYDKVIGQHQCLPPEIIVDIVSHMNFRDIVNVLCAGKHIPVVLSHMYPHLSTEAEKHASQDFLVIQNRCKEKSPYKQCFIMLTNMRKILDPQKRYCVFVGEKNVLLPEYYDFFYRKHLGALFQQYYLPTYWEVLNLSYIVNEKIIETTGINRRTGNTTMIIKKKESIQCGPFKIKPIKISIGWNKKFIHYTTYDGFGGPIVDYLTKNPCGGNTIFCMRRLYFEDYINLLKKGNLDQKVRDDGRTVKDFLQLFSHVIDYGGEFLIHDLIRRGDEERLEQIKHLVENCDVNPNITSGNRKTPLHIAAKLGRKKITEYLICIGVCLNARDEEDKTPLHYACQGNKNNNNNNNDNLRNIVEQLLAAGADMNSRDSHGRRPLHYAAIRNDLDIIALLILYGAKVNPVDSFGCTPFDYALYKSDQLIMQLLQQNGGKNNGVCVIL